MTRSIPPRWAAGVPNHVCYGHAALGKVGMTAPAPAVPWGRLQAVARRWARRWLDRSEDVDEAVQAALVRALEDQGCVEERGGSMELRIRSYVRTEARRRWATAERGLDAGEDADWIEHTAGTDIDPERALGHAKRAELIFHCLDKLSEVERATMELAIAGMSNAEIGLWLHGQGLAVSHTANSVYHKRVRARARLMACVGASLVSRSTG